MPLHVINTHTVKEVNSNTRFSEYVCGLFPALPSRKSVKKAIKSGRVLLNGKPAETGRYIKKDDVIDLAGPVVSPHKPHVLLLDVLYEDDYIAVINKPAGIVVSGNRFRTIENALCDNLYPSTLPDALSWPKPVHRLDSQTQGLLLIAKTAQVHMHLGQLFENRQVEKVYRAVVAGTVTGSGTIDFPVEERDAVTEYRGIRTVQSLKNGSVSLVELHPRTGRTHQLRIHMSRIGHPVMGDVLYGEPGKTMRHKGLFLAAVGLSCIHPVTEKIIDIHIDDPPKFHSFMQREQRRWEKYHG